MNRSTVRATAFTVLAADVVAVLVTVTVVSQRPDPAPPVRHTVVDSRCIDGRITQGIDDHNPAGLLAYDTGVTC